MPKTAQTKSKTTKPSPRKPPAPAKKKVKKVDLNHNQDTLPVKVAITRTNGAKVAKAKVKKTAKQSPPPPETERKKWTWIQKELEELMKASEDGVSMTRGDLREVIASGSNRHIKLLASGKLRADSHPRSAQEMACKWNKLKDAQPEPRAKKVDLRGRHTAGKVCPRKCKRNIFPIRMEKEARLKVVKAENQELQGKIQKLEMSNYNMTLQDNPELAEESNLVIDEDMEESNLVIVEDEEEREEGMTEEEVSNANQEAEEDAGEVAHPYVVMSLPPVEITPLAPDEVTSEMVEVPALRREREEGMTEEELPIMEPPTPTKQVRASVIKVRQVTTPSRIIINYKRQGKWAATPKRGKRAAK